MAVTSSRSSSGAIVSIGRGTSNPLTHIVDAERALFVGEVGDKVVLWGPPPPAEPEAKQCHNQRRRRKSTKSPAAMATMAPTTIGKAAPCSSRGMCWRFMP